MITQEFSGTLRRKQGGRFIGISIHKYLSTSKTGTAPLSSLLLLLSFTEAHAISRYDDVCVGITTDFDTVPIAPFHFYKLAPHILDPRDETQHQ
jgi:hypothetical protein